MRIRRLFLTSVVLLLNISAFGPEAVSQSGQTTSRPDTRSFSEAERRGPDGKWLFLIATSIGSYTIRSDGFVEAPGQYWHRNMTLPFGHSGFLDRLYFLEHENDLLLIYEVSSVDSGWGYVTRVNQKNLKIKWSAPISSYNIGSGLIEGDSLYFSSANQFSKLDLKSGAYLWQTTLEKKYGDQFESFQVPSVAGEHVVFEETNGKKRTVEIEKTTGKILTVKD